MLEDNKTIFALATAPGKSGVAIIRISGPGAFLAIKILTKSPKPKDRQASLRNLIDTNSNQLVDQAIIITFTGPNSFTGENIVELHIHGSRAIINILLKLLSNLSNFRIANPGEFAKRAFLNGRMDLTSAEGLADLIEAETLMQHSQAIKQMQGASGKAYQKWMEQLIELLALVEAYLDFPEEDIPDQLIQKTRNQVNNIKLEIANFLDDKQAGEIIRRGINIAIIGSPNVGKSSLLNYLAKRDVAIVSNIAGTTRDVIEVNLDLRGFAVNIADTAGIRPSTDPIESEGIKRSLARAENADLKIVMLAANDPLSLNEEIIQIIDKNCIVLINKIDQERLLFFENAIDISIAENKGIDNFIETLSAVIEARLSCACDPIITRQRHRTYLSKCYESLVRFTLDNHLELACEDLRLATRALGQIIGVVDVETILDQIFSKFCIGK